jgi:hypothetical protein
VTVQRDGIDLFRVHQSNSGHGFKITQFKNNKTPAMLSVFELQGIAPAMLRVLELQGLA